jgi:heme a synthase
LHAPLVSISFQRNIYTLVSINTRSESLLRSLRSPFSRKIQWSRWSTTVTQTVIEQNPYHATGQWLLGVSALVIGMISIGGITRLTKSGLSMTTWSITGTLPPLTLEDWQREFERYKSFPEFQQRANMTLQEFQFIYTWEYGHRMIGRFIGLAYLGPLVYFSVRKRIPVGYGPRMALLGGLGLAQGIVGWWMVQSGLTEDRRHEKKEIRVKPLRLATHLSMAVVTYSLLFWTAMDMVRYPIAVTPRFSPNAQPLVQDIVKYLSRIRVPGVLLTALTGITIVSGAFVAGNDAGRAYNTFPKMNDEWFPSDYFSPSEWSRQEGRPEIWRNLYENTATVQFNHRVCGSLTAITGASLALYGLYRFPSTVPSSLFPSLRTGLMAVGLAVTGQFALGVTTLLTYVPISLAALHQLGSIVVLTSSLYLLHSVRTVSKSLLHATRAAQPIARPAATAATRSVAP